MLHRFAIHRRQGRRFSRSDLATPVAAQFDRRLYLAGTKIEPWSLARIDEGEGLTRFESTDAENRRTRSVLPVVDVEEETSVRGWMQGGSVV
jgi:hypothetical protein